MKLSVRSIFFATFGALVITGCSKNDGPEYVDIGHKWPIPVEQLKQIPYRFFDVSDDKGGTGILKKTTDMVGVTLDLQSGKARGARLLFNVSHCFGPEVRNGLPTVMCSVESNGDMFVAGDQEVREKLLRIKSDNKQIGTVSGRLVGLRNGHPIVQVDHP